VPDDSILEGKITHLKFTLAFTAEFRINGGAVLCRAMPPYSLSITEKRGWPGHNVRVSGQYANKILAISSLDVLD
jgi:hypothetical protein